jgi:hypothetical protein
MASKRTSPKFAIANGFIIGSFSQEIYVFQQGRSKSDKEGGR